MDASRQTASSGRALEDYSLGCPGGRIHTVEQT